MSRTYRARRLPRIPGTPLKITDADFDNKGRNRWNTFRDSFPEEVADEVKRQLYKNALAEKPEPMGSIWDHPLINFARVKSPRKKPLRIHGNRRVRRMSKTLSNCWAQLGDDFNNILPVKRDGWDTWRIR
jgi:hypothetical protein